LQLHQLRTQGIVILFRGCTELQVPITDDSVLVDQEDGALIDSAELRREARIRFRNRVVVILQERERQLMGLSPLVMRKNVIAAYSEELRVELAKVVPSVPEGTYFGRSATCPVSDVERKNYVRAFQA
jgi:hypothetical protein